MDTNAYIDRTWTLAEIPMGSLKTLPLVDGPYTMTRIIGSDSPAAKSFDQQGIYNVFYYDYEQLLAGLETTYGLLALQAAAEDIVFPDGQVLKQGKLIASITKLDMEKQTVTVMLEQ